MHCVTSLNQKILIILGPTASGISDLAVFLAEKFNGEVVSADSRQVYRGMDIGTGKITRDEMRGIPHHLLDVADPKKTYTAATYVTDATKAIADIQKRGRLPIICGGSGFYIRALVDGVVENDVPPNKLLRKELRGKTVPELVAQLEKVDPIKLASMNESDRKNPRRLERAIEIGINKLKVKRQKAKVRSQMITGDDLLCVPIETSHNSKGSCGEETQSAIDYSKQYQPLFIGLNCEPALLKEKIRNRLIMRIQNGMLEEAQLLHDQGLSWKRMEELGLEYRYQARFLKQKKTKNMTLLFSKEEMVEKLNTQIWQYAKKQMTWFRKDQRIQWFGVKEREEIQKVVEKFVHTQ